MAMALLPVHAAMLFSLVGAIVWVKLFDFLARHEVLDQVRRSFKQKQLSFSRCKRLPHPLGSGFAVCQHIL